MLHLLQNNKWASTYLLWCQMYNSIPHQSVLLKHNEVAICWLFFYQDIWYYSDTSAAAAAAAAKSLQSCPTLCDPWDGSPPGSPFPGILQARTLEGVAISFSNAWKWKVKGKSQSYPTVSNPMDCSLPSSSVHGIFQARVLVWDAIDTSVG